MKLHDLGVSLDDLAAFAVVSQSRSFTKAAASLKTSTSNLSHTIRRLETQLGYRVLQRNSRSVSTTEAGDELLEILKPALENIGTALETLEESRDSVSGTLRLTLTRQAYEAVIRPILPGFLAAYPRATVEISIDYAYRDIVADGLDAGIRLGEKVERDMIALKIGSELRMAVVATPHYIAQFETITHPNDLMRHRCINYRMIAANAIYAWEFERLGQEVTVPVTGPLTVSEPDLMLQMALDGLGVAFILDHEAAPYLEDGRLVRLIEEWTPPFPGFYLYYLSRRQIRPILAAFLSMLRSRR
ncbi:LysR family transcriptional regulator [Rhizobium sp. ICMP 5592]|uniref:LysR family transcriptional regulator n=1 Tax=Rhizobium sp. ICMP 5592 TaxID=2292445 RepID=UPI00129521C7|nr:LysR family transcriptional regulator [Rhizobium sp. ICMP 5592]MQB41016.1 LysR family transcriptional regulator [Rhizobium sp. ICMP 5592]